MLLDVHSLPCAWSSYSHASWCCKLPVAALVTPPVAALVKTPPGHRANAELPRLPDALALCHHDSEDGPDLDPAVVAANDQPKPQNKSPDTYKSAGSTRDSDCLKQIGWMQGE